MPFDHAARWGDDTVTDTSGRPLATGTMVTVRNLDLSLADVYEDEDRTVADNPVAVGSAGNLAFYADPGEYLLEANGVQIQVAVPVNPADVGGVGGGDMTGAEILAELLTVDGAGSLLSADLLDGLSSLDFETPAGAQSKADAKVTQTITNGVTTTAPSEDAVFDALALKETPAGAQAKADAKVADAINDGTTAVAPSQNVVFDALALKAPLASPTFTGTAAAPTPAAADNSTKIATTAYVDTADAQVAGLFKIAEFDLGASAASFDFTSIAATYQHLKLILLLRSDVAATADSVNLVLNNDTTAGNYDRQRMTAAAAATGANEVLAGANARIVGLCSGASSPANHFSVVEITVFNYAKTNMFKIAQVFNAWWGGRTTGLLQVGQHMLGYASTSAINRLTVLPFTGPNFVAGSTASLYGIKAA